VDVFLSTNVNGRFITLMHLTRSRVLIMTNFTAPWSNLRMTQIASSTLSSTMLIMCITFATMRQWRALLSWTTSPNVVHLPNSSATAHRLRLVNMSSRLFDPYTAPLGRVSRISSIRTLPNASTRTSNDCPTPSLTTLGLRHALGFFVSCSYVCFLLNNT
jgi:hypothetical protein